MLKMYKKSIWAIEVQTSSVNVFMRGEICGIARSFIDGIVADEDYAGDKTRFTFEATPWQLVKVIDKIETVLPNLYFRVL